MAERVGDEPTEAVNLKHLANARTRPLYHSTMTDILSWKRGNVNSFCLCYGSVISSWRSGKVNQKVEPTSGVLSTPTLPPCCSMIVLQMYKPSPRPA